MLYTKIDKILIENSSRKFIRNLSATIDFTKLSDGVGASTHACSILYKNQIIGYGVNKRKTHPLQNKYQKRIDCNYLHAEIDALVQVINKHGTDILQDCSMIVCRTFKNGELASSKPCSGCMKAIEAFNLRRVFYT